MFKLPSVFYSVLLVIVTFYANGSLKANALEDPSIVKSAYKNFSKKYKKSEGASSSIAFLQGLHQSFDSIIPDGRKYTLKQKDELIYKILATGWGLGLSSRLASPTDLEIVVDILQKPISLPEQDIDPRNYFYGSEFKEEIPQNGDFKEHRTALTSLISTNVPRDLQRIEYLRNPLSFVADVVKDIKSRPDNWFGFNKREDVLLVVSFFTLPYWVFGSYEKMANFSNARKQYREFGDSNDANRLDITKTMYAYDNWLENSNDFNDFYNTTEISSIPEMQNIKAKLKKDIMNIHFQDVPMYLSNDQKKRFISSDKRTLADEDELSRIDSLFSNLFFQGFNELVKAYLLAKKEGDLKSFYASALMPTMCYPFRSRQITEYLLGLNRSPEEIAKGLEADVEITPIVYQLTSYIKRKLKNGTIQVPFNSTRKDFFINQITKYLSNAIQGIIQDKLVKPNVTNYEPGKGYSGFFMIFNKEKNLVDIYFTREISNNENLKRYIELKLDDKQALFDALRNITTWLLEEQVDYNENESSYIPENHKINISDDEIKKIISNVKSIKGNDNYKLSDIKAALGKSLGVSKLPSDIIARAQNLDEGE